MNAIITEEIGQQNFEIVGRQIGNILNVELSHQKALKNLKEDLSVFFERVTAVDAQAEEVVVTVLLDSVANQNSNEQDSQKTTSFFVDVYASAKAKDKQDGDSLAAMKLLQYVGMIRYILESHKYITLGLPLGTIMGTEVSAINMYEQQNNQDTSFSRMCRITFSVRLVESQDVWDGELVAQAISNIKLDLTEKGYQYKLNP